MEVWKDIKGFKHYQVSNLGRVKSIGREVKSCYGSTAKIKSNNIVTNLEWCSPSYNVRHSVAISVIRVDEKGNTKKYECIQDTLKDGFSPSHVTSCCKGRHKSHKGYKWKYYEQ